MEHLKDPSSVLIQIVVTLKHGGVYRFFCPNYDFPYEPHFGKWLYLRKNRSFYLQENRANSNLISSKEAAGLFSSLNFLTLRHVRRAAISSHIGLKCNKNALFEILRRSIYDSELGKRHPGMSRASKMIYSLKLHYLAKAVPVNLQPIMDVEASHLRR